MSRRVVLTEEERKARRRESCRRYREANAEKVREKDRRYREANAEKERERQRRYREANAEKVRERARESARRYREANAEKVRERNRRRYEANAEKERESRRRCYEANAEKERERHRRYREANAEKVREKDRRRYEANAEKMREKNRRWAEANPEKARENQRTQHRTRRAREMNAIDPSAPRATAAATARRLWLFGNACAYCGSDGPLHLDHVVPLARGGLHTPDNLVPACERCNLSKLAKPVEAWYLSQPFFCPDRWEALQAHTGRRWSAAEQLSLLDLLSA